MKPKFEVKAKTVFEDNIKPVRFEKLILPFRTQDIFDSPFKNIGALAATRSGKSVAAFHLLKKAMGPETVLYIFAPTVHSDPTFRQIQKYFEKRGNTVIAYDCIKEGKIDHLGDVVADIKQQAEEEQEEEDAREAKRFERARRKSSGKKKAPQGYIKTIESDSESESEDEEPQKKPKFEELRRVFLFDDCSTALRTESHAALLKYSRHLKAMTISNFHYLSDMLPAARANLSIFFLFKNLKDETLKEVLSVVGLIDMELGKFKALYEYATSDLGKKDTHGFLMIDKDRRQFRRKMNTVLSTDE